MKHLAVSLSWCPPWWFSRFASQSAVRALTIRRGQPLLVTDHDDRAGSGVELFARADGVILHGRRQFDVTLFRSAAAEVAGCGSCGTRSVSFE